MDWWTIVIDIVLIIDCLALICLVLLQQSRSAGLSGAIAGGAETFFGKKKAKGYEHTLEVATKVTAIIFVVLAIGALLVQKFI